MAPARSPRTRSASSPHQNLPEVILFTDGACRGNPGPGGWAYILRHVATGREKVESGGDPLTTNNQMELLAVIRGLEALKRPCRVELVTDSSYVGRGLSEWLPRWKSAGWRRREKGRLVPIKNVELWQRLDQLLQKHQVTYRAVRGHAGHPENERCDQLAVAAAERVRHG